MEAKEEEEEEEKEGDLEAFEKNPVRVSNSAILKVNWIQLRIYVFVRVHLASYSYFHVPQHDTRETRVETCHDKYRNLLK